MVPTPVVAPVRLCAFDVSLLRLVVPRTVEFVLTQPIELNIEELIIRPQKSLF